MGDVISLDIPAVKIVMELYNVEDQKQMLNDLLFCFTVERMITRKRK